MDDDMEGEQDCLLTLHLMKHVMIFVFEQIGLKTDLKHGPVSVQAR